MNLDMRVRTLMLFSLVSLLFFTGCQKRGTYTNVEVEKLQEFRQKEPKLQIVDVRTPEEYANGNIVGSTLINFMGDDFEQQATEKLDKAYPVLVYCASGNRSAKAAAALSEKGYVVYNLKGGYKAYTEQEE